MSADDLEPTAAVDAAAVDAAAGRRIWEEVAAFLGDPATHGLDEPVVRIDTHCAAVFLAGAIAYKIKRPVRFPFLDFSTLERRASFCRREICVDRAIAPSIYRRVVPITREADDRLAIDGRGETVEWAVEMNRFDETATLDRVVGRTPLDPLFSEALADEIVRAQSHARIREAGPWMADVRAYLDQNRDAFAERPDLFPPAAAARLDQLARARWEDARDLVEDRGRLGRIRLGHGDLHCANVVVMDGRPQLFDAVEFDDAIATGDVLYDVGYLIMDLDVRGDQPAARRLLNRWLQAAAKAESRGPSLRDPEDAFLTEIDGLAALPLWLCVRAGLRAKIAAATAPHLEGDARAEQEEWARRFFVAACDYVEPYRPRLLALGGMSGAGKTTLARAIASDFGPRPGAIVLRSDTIRKVVAGVADTVRLGPEHYTREASDRVYRLLVASAAAALAAGFSVVTDAVSLHPEERSRFAAIARAAEAEFTGLWLEIDPDVASKRVGERRNDASDADATVVAFQSRRDPGAIDWHRIDAGGAQAETLAAARAVLHEEFRLSALAEDLRLTDPAGPRPRRHDRSAE
ncbi:MAG: AAA family ATPase [Hyphomicrobiales bacterium]|nr:AAA family ATPase [Hyphomicrobiales bacterium]